MMLAPSDAQSRFLENLPYIERILSALSRRYGIRGDDADDFSAWAKMRLIENDYAAIAKFRGEASITTYLTVVLSMLGREYLVRQYGRWRPSAAARRAGDVAVRLETLVYRDRLSLAQAAEKLRTSGETTLGDRELSEILMRLPQRESMRPIDVGEDALVSAEAPARADGIVDDEIIANEQREASRALARALAQLPNDEQLLVRMNFWEGLSVAEIARALGVPQKPLYRRLDHALAELRRHLEQFGISRERAGALTSQAADVGPWVGVSIHDRHGSVRR